MKRGILAALVSALLITIAIVVAALFMGVDIVGSLGDKALAFVTAWLFVALVIRFDDMVILPRVNRLLDYINSRML